MVYLAIDALLHWVDVVRFIQISFMQSNSIPSLKMSSSSSHHTTQQHHRCILSKDSMQPFTKSNHFLFVSLCVPLSSPNECCLRYTQPCSRVRHINFTFQLFSLAFESGLYGVVSTFTIQVSRPFYSFLKHSLLRRIVIQTRNRNVLMMTKRCMLCVRGWMWVWLWVNVVSSIWEMMRV